MVLIISTSKIKETISVNIYMMTLFIIFNYKLLFFEQYSHTSLKKISYFEDFKFIL